MIAQRQDQNKVFSLTEHDIHTQALSLGASTAISAGKTYCEYPSRAESEACCAKLSNAGPVKCEADIGGEWCYCDKDVGTGDWD